jgi:hypothetical protein
MLCFFSVNRIHFKTNQFLFECLNVIKRTINFCKRLLTHSPVYLLITTPLNGLLIICCFSPVGVRGNSNKISCELLDFRCKLCNSKCHRLLNRPKLSEKVKQSPVCLLITTPYDGLLIPFLNLMLF